MNIAEGLYWLSVYPPVGHTDEEIALEKVDTHLRWIRGTGFMQPASLLSEKLGRSINKYVEAKKQLPVSGAIV